MKQAIAGVTPAETEEVTSMVLWPSVSAGAAGRFLGRLCSINAGVYVLRVGNLIALAAIPLALLLYFLRLLPSFYGSGVHGVRYKLTNRRVVELRSEIRGTSFKSPLHALLVLSNLIAAGLVAALLGYLGFTSAAVGFFVVVVLGLIAAQVFQWWPQFQYEAETRSVQLDRFDDVRVEVQPGQAWYHAGDLVFLQGEVETFRLPGVSRPEAFRTSCLKARASYVGVLRAKERSRVPA
jgi:hypothetical protein